MDSTTLSDGELISLFFEAAPDRIVGGIQEGNLVVKTSNDTVIKFGPGVTEDEANNQRKAYELIDHNIDILKILVAQLLSCACCHSVYLSMAT